MKVIGFSRDLPQYLKSRKNETAPKTKRGEKSQHPGKEGGSKILNHRKLTQRSTASQNLQTERNKVERGEKGQKQWESSRFVYPRRRLRIISRVERPSILIEFIREHQLILFPIKSSSGQNILRSLRVNQLWQTFDESDLTRRIDST